MAEVINLATQPLKRTLGLRLLEILPGFTTWLFLAMPIILSFIGPVWLAYIIIAYDLLWFTKACGLSYRLIRGYNKEKVMNQVKWQSRLHDLSDIEDGITRVEARLKRNRLPRLYKHELRRYRNTLRSLLDKKDQIMKPESIYHAVVIATYNESLDILEPTIKALTNSTHPLKNLWVIIAYEQRGGEQVAKNAQYLVKKYGRHFGYATSIMHPDNVPGEVIGKGPNITHAARELTKYVRKQKINPDNVVVTTLDSDNRPHANYFSYLTFTYAILPDRRYCSYQPLPMFYNNIWDVPAPMRVIATGNTFWMLMESMRPHRMRNFSAHAQGLRALIDTDYWSTTSIIEDGHQFWRTYYTYHGNHRVVPLYTPVYQDAVLARGYWRTFKAQFIQLRRWAWGVTDIPYVIINNHRYKDIKWSDKTLKLMRLYEGHFSWATSALFLAFAAWLPLLLNPDFNDQVLAHQLPVIVSRIQTIAMLGLAITIIISVISLPPRPAHYKRQRSVMMVLQWVLLPVTSIVFSSFAALTSQTRLMFGRYLDEFDVTEKATRDMQPKAKTFRWFKLGKRRA